MDKSNCAQCCRRRQKPATATGRSLPGNTGQTCKPYDMLTDFITGKAVPDIGAEANRQAVERFLVEEKGYSREDLEVDVPIELIIRGAIYRSTVDLAVSVHGKRYLLIKCASGSLGSREREIVSAARLIDADQIPLSAVSDGKTAILIDTVSGRKLGEGLAALPSRQAAEARAATLQRQALAENRRDREKLIFRSYDMMNVNVGRRVSD